MGLGSTHSPHFPLCLPTQGRSQGGPRGRAEEVPSPDPFLQGRGAEAANDGLGRQQVPSMADEDPREPAGIPTIQGDFAAWTGRLHPRDVRWAPPAKDLLAPWQRVWRGVGSEPGKPPTQHGALCAEESRVRSSNP